MCRSLFCVIVASLEMMLSKKRITKALISLRGCAGWSAPLMFADPEDRFSRADDKSCTITMLPIILLGKRELVALL